MRIYNDDCPEEGEECSAEAIGTFNLLDKRGKI